MRSLIGKFLAGLLLLVLFLYCGVWLSVHAPLPLPATVWGFALLAAVLVLAGACFPSSMRWVASPVEAASRPLLAHLGLLFVPAGVGVVDAVDLLKQEWIPVLLALCVSTWCGLAATAWVMQRFGKEGT